ncbi:ABC transporter permease [Clostridioides difficile]|nr:ABC transporter permease [Clostridioides difficile]MDS6233656.1 ABC transporter permease [Clostridioides difficile]MDU8900286.1 ABC transporter permease [Clostridioides difficile]
MLFIKDLKKICFSFVYILFVGLLLFSWNENFYGVTSKEIQASNGTDTSITSQITGVSILAKPEQGAENYGSIRKEVPDKIMCGGTDMLIIEYLKNSYATYPFNYYKEVILSTQEQKEILSIIEEITGLSEEQIKNLPEDYFPSVNGNIIHMGGDVSQNQDESFSFQTGNNDTLQDEKDYTKHFIAQVSYERFKELMAKAEEIIGSGSNYSMDMLLEYYGQVEMTYDEAMNEYNKTIYDDKVSTAFARLFCDYMTRDLGLYPVFLVAIFWLKDRRNRMNELIDCKQIGTAKLVAIRFLAMLVAVMIPIFVLSFESLIPLMKFSTDTGIAIDVFAFLKYIVWWLLPTAMIVTSLGMFLTILTSTPIAILVQFVWWFIDSAITGLSGDIRLYTLMIRHNTLNGAELVQQNFNIICLNRGIMIILSFILICLSIVIYNKKRGGKLDYGYFMQKHFGVFKNRLLARFQK